MTAEVIIRPEWELCEHSAYAGKTVAEMKCTACGMPFVGGTFTTTANPLPAPNVNDPAAFWASLKSAQALALLKAAPKVAGPVEPHPFLGPTRSAVYVVEDSVISASDEKLKELGWLLVDSEVPI